MASNNALYYIRRKTARYVRNVGRSVGYVAIEEVKPNTGAIKQLYKDARELSSNLKANGAVRRANKASSRAQTTTLGQSARKQKKQSELTKNLISDLKTGKWYNKGRMEQSSSDAFDFGEDPDNYTGVNFDFGDDDDFGDAIYNDGQSSAGSGRKKASSVSKAFAQAGIAMGTVSAEAYARSAEYIAESNNSAAQAIYDSMNYNFGQVMVGLNAINTNIEVVQATIGEQLSTHALNSAKFYIDTNKYQQESLELLRNISKGVEAINANTAPSTPNGRRRTGKEYTLGGILNNGIPDMKALMANARKGFKEEFIPSILMMLGLGGDMGGSGAGLASNPIGIVATELMRMFGIDLVPPRLKRGVSNVNNIIRNMFTGGISKLRGYDFTRMFNKSNGIGGALGGILNNLKEALLPKYNDHKIDTGNYNKRRVDWDGISRKALVEVIPTQLGKILSALTGENEMRFDYEHGKWVDTHKSYKEEQDRITREKYMAGGDFMGYASSLVTNSKYMSQKQKNNMNRMLKDFNSAAYDKIGTSSELDYLRIIDPNVKIHDILPIAKAYGIRNESEIKSLRALVANMNKTSVGRNAVKGYHANLVLGKDIAGHDARYRESLNDAAINMFYDGSYDFGNAAVAKTKATSVGSRANWRKNKTVNSVMYTLDNYGHDIYFYLQGIFMYTKHVSDNLKHLINGPSAAGVELEGVPNLNQIKGIEPIKSIKVKKDADDIPEPRRQDVRRFKTDADELRATDLSFDPNAPEDVRQYSRLRSYLISMGMDENDLNNSKQYGEQEKKYQKYIGGSGVKAGKIRDFIGKSRIGRKAIGKYDAFVDALEAIGGSRNDLNRALGALIPGYNALMGNQKLQTFANNARGHVNNIRSNIGSGKAFNAIFSPEFAEFIAGEGGYNPPSARGRKVTKTGIVAVSEGELIIPSELNPYYHGVTNKAQQIRDENRAVQQYFGSYARGGVVQHRDPRVNLQSLTQFFMKKKKMDKKTAFQKAREALKDYEARFNAGKREGISEGAGEGATSGISLRGMVDSAKSTAHNVFNTIGEGAVNMFGPKNKQEADAEKKKVAELIDGTFADFGASKSSVITGAVMGGGISLLTGAIVGPVAGAAIGAATGLIANSNKVQEALFGKDVIETDEEGKEVKVHKKGLLPEKLGEFIKNSVPSMAKGTVGGWLTGAAFFGSPLIGAIAGSAVGYIQSSEKAKNFLFGEIDEKTGGRKGGVIPKELQTMVKKAVPNMAAGAALGLLAGPFSLPANIIVGSALGFASSTDKFKKWMYGDENGEGGLAGKIKKELFEPITKGFLDLTSIATQQVKNLGKSLMKNTREFLFKHALKALYKTRIGQKLLGAGKKIVGGAYNLITKPGQMLLANRRKKAFRKGYTIEGLTSGQRMKMRYDEFGNPYDVNDDSQGFAMDTLLSTLSGNEQREQLLSAVEGVDKAGLKTESDIKVERKKFAKMIQKAYKDANLEPGRDSKALNELYDDVIYGRFIGDENELRDRINRATKNRLTGKAEGEKLLRELTREFGTLDDFNTRRDREINDAKQKAYEIIDSNPNLSEDQKALLRKKIDKGDTTTIEYMKNQLGIDMKSASQSEAEGGGEKAVHMAPEIEMAIKEKIPDKITELINSVGHSLNLIYSKMTHQDVGELDDKLGINSKEAGEYRYKQTEKAHGDALTDALLSGDPYELEAAMQDFEDFSGSGSRRRIQRRARGGRVRRGLAAVSKGELILPRNFFGKYALGGMVDDPDTDSKGEDTSVRDQFGNAVENLGSSKVQKAKKEKSSFFSAMKAIPAGFAAMNNTLGEIKEALIGGYQEGGQKKSGLLDTIKDALFGGLASKVQKLIAGAINLAAPVFAGLLAGKIALGIAQGKYDKIGEALGYGQADHAGMTVVDEDGDYVTKDANGTYVKEDGTPANGRLKVVDSATTDSMSDRFKSNFVRGIVTGTGTAAGAMIKGAMKMTRSGKAVLGAASKGAAWAGSKLAKVSLGQGKNIAAAFKAERAAGKTAMEAMEAVNKSSIILKLRSSLLKFATKIKKVPLVGKFATYIDDICKNLLEFVEKKTLGAGAKAVGSILKSAAVVVTWALVVADFVTGWQDAEKILGVKKATAAQSFGCALGRALLRAIPFIGSFLPEKEIIKFIFKHLPGGDKLAQQQDEMQAIVDEYNEENGTDYTVEEYLTEVEGQSNIVEKAGNFIKTGWTNLTNKKSTATASAGGSYLGSYANGGVVGSALGAVSSIGSTIDESTGGRLSSAVDKIKQSVDKGDIKGVISSVSKIGLGVASGALMPALIGPAIINSIINKVTGSTDVNKTGGNLSKAATAITSLIDYAKSGNTEAMDGLSLGTDSGMFNGIFNFAKGIVKVGTKIGSFLGWFGNKSSSTDNSDTSASGSGFVSQYDPRYRNKRLGGRSIADNGCGPATAVMAINQLNSMSGRGTSMNSAINHAARYQTAGGTDASYFADEFARNGYRANYSTNRRAMFRNIAAGRPVILMGNAGGGVGGPKAYTPFGPNNHYVVANGIDSRGNIIISDPEQGGARAYSPSILRQVRLGISGSGAADKITNATQESLGYETGDSNFIPDYQKAYNARASAGIDALINGTDISGTMADEMQKPGSYSTEYNAPSNLNDYQSFGGVTINKKTGKIYQNGTAIGNTNPAKDTTNSKWKTIAGGISINTETGGIYQSGKQTGSTSGYNNWVTIPGGVSLNKNTGEFFSKGEVIGYADAGIKKLGYTNINTNSSPYTITRVAGANDYETPSEKAARESQENDPYAGMGPLEAIIAVFTNAIANRINKFRNNKNKTKSNTKYDPGYIGGSLSLMTGKDPVSYMESVMGQLVYDMEGPRDPEKGSADCSSTVRWAYLKATGLDLGNTSQAQAKSKYLEVVADAGGRNQYFDAQHIPEDLRRNDVLFFMRKRCNGDIGHVGLYIGNGQYIDHGSGMGPKVKTLNGSKEQGLTRVMRLKQEYMDQLMTSGGTGIGSNMSYGKVGGQYPDTEVTRQIYKYFTSLGYSPAATTGIMGNMYRESRFDPSIVQKGSGHAAGIVQWESYKNKSQRWLNLSNYAASKGKSWQDLISQLEFIDKEMREDRQYIGKNASTYKSANEYFNATDPQRAAYDFEKAYERGSVEAMDERMGASQAYYNAYSGGADSSDVSGISVGGSLPTTAGSYLSERTNMDLNPYDTRMSGSGSGLYNAMNRYIARRGTRHSAGASGINNPITVPTVNSRNLNIPVSTSSYGTTRRSRATNTNNADPLTTVVIKLTDIVDKLVVAHDEDFHNITEIYNLMVDDRNVAAKGSGTKPVVSHYTPRKERSYEQIANDFADIKATINQIMG